MTPKHLRQIPKNRQAIAPYNFVELPDKVVEVAEDDLPHHNSYESKRHTGRIECILTTSSPLYIRCGWTPEEFTEFSETLFKDLPETQKHQRANFFHNPANQRPIIPGSSLRGMLRTLTEIVSFSKIEKISAQQLIYRAVGDTTSLGIKYRERLLTEDSSNAYSFLMKAGYIVQLPSGWAIRPAQPIIPEESFARIEQSDINMIRVRLERWHEIRNADKIAVSITPAKLYNHNQNRVKLRYAKATPLEGSDHRGSECNGVLVKTGSAPRKHMQFVFGLPDTNADLIHISDEMIQKYKEQITDGQQQILGNDGALQPMQPIFYIFEDNKLVFFGHAMMFRLPYENSVEKFIPVQVGKSEKIDIAEAIFGFVKDKKTTEKQAKSRSGRVFISDGVCEKTASDDIWLTPSTIIPKILTTPKPTTFQHYLVQTIHAKKDLKHYASNPEQETIIRGHKLYWHKGASPAIQHEKPHEASDTQTTEIKPIKPGVNFHFTIYFENLNDVELGALLWVLDVAKDDKYRLSLGMGKPIGMGSVRITHDLYLNDRLKRYQKLFEGNQWVTGDHPSAKFREAEYLSAFEKHICQKLDTTEGFKEIRRIKMLFAMLSWKEDLDPNEIDQRRYMKIERDVNERHVIGQPRPGDTKVNEYCQLRFK